MASENNDIVEKITAWLGTGSINIFGFPFAGKDTQAERIGEILNAPVIAGGDILRSHPDQVMVKRLMSTGELFPTDLYLEIILPYLSQSSFMGKSLILSSVGRWHGEEDVVLRAAAEAKHPIKAAIFLRIDEKEVWNRWEISQGRNTRGPRYDDAKIVLEVRLEEFRNKTIPVIEHYRRLGLLLEIDGSGTRDEVKDRILRQLNEYISTP